MVSGGLHSHTLLQPVDRGGGEGQAVGVRTGFPGVMWLCAGTDGLLIVPMVEVRVPSTAGPSLFCPPRNCRGPVEFLPQPCPEVDSVAGFARHACCPCLVLRLRVRVRSTWEILRLLGEEMQVVTYRAGGQSPSWLISLEASSKRFSSPS